MTNTQKVGICLLTLIFTFLLVGITEYLIREKISVLIILTPLSIWSVGATFVILFLNNRERREILGMNLFISGSLSLMVALLCFACPATSGFFTLSIFALVGFSNQ